MGDKSMFSSASTQLQDVKIESVQREGLVVGIGGTCHPSLSQQPSKYKCGKCTDEPG